MVTERHGHMKRTYVSVLLHRGLVHLDAGVVRAHLSYSLLAVSKLLKPKWPLVKSHTFSIVSTFESSHFGCSELGPRKYDMSHLYGKMYGAIVSTNPELSCFSVIMTAWFTSSCAPLSCS